MIRTAESEYLFGLARRIADVYVARCAPRAILLAGSAGEGLADAYSDIDLIVYYADQPPLDEQLVAVRTELGAEGFREIYPRTEGRGCSEAYRLEGIQVEVGHATIWDVEERASAVFEATEPASRAHKAIIGQLNGIALYGEDQIEVLAARAREFPDALARAMVEHYLRAIFPLWYIADAMAHRDAQFWVRQMLAESALNLVGVLAGLNHRYYVPFQFKRTHRFIASLDIAPIDLADRLESALAADTSTGIAQIEALVGETVALVNAHLPEVDTASLLRHQPGERQKPFEWRMGTPSTSGGVLG